MTSVTGLPYDERIDVPGLGFVRLIDTMGGDAAVVQAARVSYGAGTKRVSDDRALIRYLMRHGHTSPFEMAEVRVHIRAPMDVWRQWTRTRTASINEYSTRYSEAIDEMARTDPAAWRRQSTANKQGSDGFLPVEDGELLSSAERDLHAHARRVYEERLAAGVAREQARKDLPLSTSTEAYWKIDLHNLFRFLKQRLDPAAQQEIRAYATVIAERIVAPWVPLAWEAFQDYQLNAVTFSFIELCCLATLIDPVLEPTGIPSRVADFSRVGMFFSGRGEWREFLAKMERLIGQRDSGKRS